MRVIRVFSLVITIIGAMELARPDEVAAAAMNACGVCWPYPNPVCPTSGEMETTCITYCGGYSYAPFCSSSSMCDYDGVPNNDTIIMCRGNVT